MRTLFLLPILCVSLLCFGQKDNQSTLSLDAIMTGENFVGYLPTNVQWSPDSKTIYFSWNPDFDTLRSTYSVSVDSKAIKKLTYNELRNRLTGSSSVGSISVREKGGDLFLLDETTFKQVQITNTLERESNPLLTANKQNVIYRKGRNIYSWNIADGSTTQLSDFRSGVDKEEVLSAQEQWLEDDQLQYFEILEKRKNQRDAREYRRESISPDRPMPIYLANKSLRGITASPKGTHLIYQLVSEAGSPRTIVPDYVTQSGHTKDLNTRPKVGENQDKYESWVFNTQTDSLYKIDVSTLPGIRNKPAYLMEYAEDIASYSPTYEKDRAVYIDNPVFSKNGKAVVNVTSQDYKDRWIASIDLNSGKLKVIDHQHDDAWIGGPEVGWFSRGKIEWIDNDNIWFKSEKTGFAHLYSANVNTGKIKALTKGDYEVLSTQLSSDKTTFYLTTNEGNPHQQHFYHMNVKGGKRNKITSKPGGYEVSVSPDEKLLAIRYSYTNKPWELYLMENKSGGRMTQLTNSTTAEFNSYEWLDSDIIRFKAADGIDVPATLYKPDEGKANGAAVIFVHGAGYLQNVHQWWPGYFREYMFHNLLRDNGYTVLAIDFRASAGYGRDWRTAIYRHMGGKDLSDQVDGAKYLVESHGIDANKIGIYGGSYGGFITLMAMFQHADTFASGAALRSVTDWAHYNHGYTANILNTPLQDSIAYRRSSPIYFAEGLEGDLVMLHGMIDTNVHFQDVVRLSQRLIELKKDKWELAVFPLEGHGFVESSSWRDEYRRIYELFERTLK